MKLHQIEHDPALSPPPASDGSLVVTETFVSLQGEGKLTGVASWFCRVGGCNLRCAWCDTPYSSWHPEGVRRSIDELVSEALTHAHRGVMHAVITGGEPMVFPSAALLARRLREHRVHVTIETAGTLDSGAPADLMSISPKLASSTPTRAQARTLGGDGADAWAERHGKRRINLVALQSLIDRCPERQLKFVVCGPGDIDEIDTLLGRLRGWTRADVMLMPEGTSTPARDKVAWIAKTCLERGWRYCHRLHIELYGNTRGT
jgi:7-carboxy-7-deazaguanine synthase